MIGSARIPISFILSQQPQVNITFIIIIVRLIAINHFSYLDSGTGERTLSSSAMKKRQSYGTLQASDGQYNSSIALNSNSGLSEIHEKAGLGSKRNRPISAPKFGGNLRKFRAKSGNRPYRMSE